MYRTDKAVAAMASVILKKLVIGFAYEVSSRAELASAKTNEIMLQFKF
jgi:hypothetical protein